MELEKCFASFFYQAFFKRNGELSIHNIANGRGQSLIKNENFKSSLWILFTVFYEKYQKEHFPFIQILNHNQEIPKKSKAKKSNPKLCHKNLFYHLGDRKASFNLKRAISNSSN